MSKPRAKLDFIGTGIFAVAESVPVAPVRKTVSSRSASEEEAIARPDREGRKPIPFWTTEAAKKQLRMMAAEHDTTQQDLMTEALNMLFREHGKPPIA